MFDCNCGFTTSVSSIGICLMDFETLFLGSFPCKIVFLLVNWPLYHYIMSLSISGNSPC